MDSASIFAAVTFILTALIVINVLINSGVNADNRFSAFSVEASVNKGGYEFMSERLNMIAYSHYCVNEANPEECMSEEFQNNTPLISNVSEAHYVLMIPALNYGDGVVSINEESETLVLSR